MRGWGRRAGRRRRRLPVGALLAIALATVAAGLGTAFADNPTLDPCTDGSLPGGCDTEYTPVAKPDSLWTLVSGAKFGKDGQMVDNSWAPYTVDFYTTTFPGWANGNEGYAAGAECKDPAVAFQDA